MHVDLGQTEFRCAGQVYLCNYEFISFAHGHIISAVFTWQFRNHLKICIRKRYIHPRPDYGQKITTEEKLISWNILRMRCQVLLVKIMIIKAGLRLSLSAETGLSNSLMSLVTIGLRWLSNIGLALALDKRSSRQWLWQGIKLLFEFVWNRPSRLFTLLRPTYTNYACESCDSGTWFN